MQSVLRARAIVCGRAAAAAAGAAAARLCFASLCLCLSLSFLPHTFNLTRKEPSVLMRQRIWLCICVDVVWVSVAQLINCVANVIYGNSSLLVCGELCHRNQACIYVID